VGKPPGDLRGAEATDCQLILAWMHGFGEDTAEGAPRDDDSGGRLRAAVSDPSQTAQGLRAKKA
jgi:hypothetical protein